jgi:hypothetical protein
MSTMPHPAREVIVGVDTHEREHVAALVDELGRLLATRSFRANERGFTVLLAWSREHGVVRRAGVEGTGSFGVGLARFLAEHGIEVLEVTRPSRRSPSPTFSNLRKPRLLLPSQATQERGFVSQKSRTATSGRAPALQLGPRADHCGVKRDRAAGARG